MRILMKDSGFKLLEFSDTAPSTMACSVTTWYINHSSYCLSVAPFHLHRPVAGATGTAKTKFRKGAPLAITTWGVMEKMWTFQWNRLNLESQSPSWFKTHRFLHSSVRFLGGICCIHKISAIRSSILGRWTARKHRNDLVDAGSLSTHEKLCCWR